MLNHICTFVKYNFETFFILKNRSILKHNDLYNFISQPILCYVVEQMYTFTVRTMNDAVDSTSETSQLLTCTTKAGGKTLLYSEYSL